MNHKPSLPAPIEKRACVNCRAELPMALLRLLATEPDRFVCTNQAACRKRQRKAFVSTPTPTKP